MSDDFHAYQRLAAMSQPVPADTSRGHELHLAEWKIVDGGVVDWRYRAFCRCGWSQDHAIAERPLALKAYKQHAQ